MVGVGVNAEQDPRRYRDNGGDSAITYTMQLSLIRPLGNAGTSTPGTKPQFLCNVEQEINIGMPHFALLSGLFVQIRT